ncbi:allantoicase [Oerskovia flava]|uniref:allantoicase n=1 Tax=Oerskovia flava TaxID=2986422 RepID=UPI00223E916E|nr:allantoicase [Oerskovia sp. JB1-3-2]
MTAPHADAVPAARFLALPDLASRALGGSVVWASDELFAQRENLITPGPSVFDPTVFGHKGKVYDGWETRRRRDGGDRDAAIVRLGAAGIVHGVVVDTAWFRGNYPPYVSVEATSVEGYPSTEELLAAPWTTIVERQEAQGDSPNAYEVDDRTRWTHVRLTIYPDGGVARLRVHGEVVADPRFLVGTIDLAAAENGGRLVETSDAFYSSPANLIMPGRAAHMGQGWENARRRGPGNDVAVFALAQRGTVRHVEVDTTYFVGNAPGAVRLAVHDAGTHPGEGDDLTAGAPSGTWVDVLPRTDVLADTRHRYVVADAPPATHLRLDVYPDGGLSRLRVWGDLSPEDLVAARRRWWAALPEAHRALVPHEAPPPAVAG